VRVNAAVVDDVLTGVCVMITVLDFVWVADGNVVRDAVAAIDVVSAGVTESDGRWEWVMLVVLVLDWVADGNVVCDAVATIDTVRDAVLEGNTVEEADGEDVAVAVAVSERLLLTVRDGVAESIPDAVTLGVVDTDEFSERLKEELSEADRVVDCAADGVLDGVDVRETLLDAVWDALADGSVTDRDTERTRDELLDADTVPHVDEAEMVPESDEEIELSFVNEADELPSSDPLRDNELSPVVDADADSVDE
jgi:hypothetical protein